MAKVKVPVEEQAAALTPEQKANVKRVFKREVIISVILIVLILATSVNQYLKGNALDEAVSYVEFLEAEEAFDTAFILNMVVCGVGIAICICLTVYRKKNYPYCNNKLYFYLRKQDKLAQKAQ